MAAPSLRNSGLDTTSNSTSALRFASDSATAAPHLVGGSDRHGRLGDDHLVFGHVLADGPRDRQHIFQVGGAVFIGRCAHRDELQLAVRHAFGGRGRETQAFGLGIGLDQGIEARFMDGDFAPLEAFDLFGVYIDAKHVIAGIGKACAGDEADVTGSEYGDSHVFPEPPEMGARGGILTNSAYKSGPSRYRNAGNVRFVRPGRGVAARALSHHRSGRHR